MDEPERTSETYLIVRHCVLVRDGKTDESWQARGATGGAPYVLRGVSYRYQVAPEVEFPTAAKPPWAVYLRITGSNVGPARVLFRVHYRSRSGTWEHLDWSEMDRAIPFPDTGEETHDIVLNLPFLRIGGAGLHAISVHFWYDGVELEDDWGREDPIEEAAFRAPDWAFGAVEYFWIERPS